MIFETRKIEAAIFDMDGTMFDTERLRIKMLKMASKEICGESIKDEILIDSLGLSAKKAEELSKKHYGNDYPYKEIREKADELEVEYVRENGIPVKEGLFDVLDRLKKNGVLLAVATSSKRSITEEYLLNARIKSYFDVIVCGDEVENGKPNPEIFIKAANELNCSLLNSLIFEDSQNGLLAATASGANAVFIKDIKEPEKRIKDRTFRAYDSMVEFLEDLAKFTSKMPTPKINEMFPQKLNHIKVGIHGFGAIGGGYLTQIFSHWDGYTRPMEIIGATSNETLNEVVNSFGRFNVYYESLAFMQTINNVRIINSKNEDDMKEMYLDSEIIGLALPENAIKSQSKIIAKGLVERYDRRENSLTILIVLNKIGAGEYVKNSVEKELKKLVGDERSAEIIEKTYFSETVVNRMVSKINSKSVLKQVRRKFEVFERNNYMESFNSLTIGEEQNSIDIKDISEKISEIWNLFKEVSNLNITLFNSEPDMTLYASKGSPILETLRQVKTVEDIGKMQEVKNKLSNGTHAMIAWYSQLLGYRTIGQGMGDERIHSFVKGVMQKEIKPILIKKDKNLSDYIDKFIEKFIKRCRYSFKDPCNRVGRDPLRKLQKGERILGTIDLAKKNDVSTKLLQFGAATGLLYAVSLANPEDKESKLIREIYEQKKSIRDVLTYKGEYNGKSYPSLDKEMDNDIIVGIEKQFNKLASTLNYSI